MSRFVCILAIGLSTFLVNDLSASSKSAGGKGHSGRSTKSTTRSGSVPPRVKSYQRPASSVGRAHYSPANSNFDRGAPKAGRSGYPPAINNRFYDQGSSPGWSASTPGAKNGNSRFPPSARQAATAPVPRARQYPPMYPPALRGYTPSYQLFYRVSPESPWSYFGSYPQSALAWSAAGDLESQGYDAFVR
jgi:hypothetical protein